MNREKVGRLAIAVLVTEFFIRHVTGIAGLIFPYAGVVVQQSLIIWGLVATIIAMALVARLPRDIALPTLGLAAVLGALVGVRIPLSAEVSDIVVLGFGTWARLALPIATMTLFAVSLESSISAGEARVRSSRSHLVLGTVALGTGLVYAWLRATGSAWSWSPQQPVPYLLLAALGATGVGWLLLVATAAVLILLSLKRSAAVAFVGFLLVAPRPTLPTASRVPAAVASIITALLVVVGVYLSPAAEIIRSRAASGLEQVLDVAVRELPEESSLQVRVIENREALALWKESPSTVLIGTAVARELRTGDRLSTTVHNTYLSMLQLGGFGYVALLAVLAGNLRKRLGRLRRPTHYRWYFAGSVATLLEAVAGNSLLTVALGASLAVLIRAPARGPATRGGSSVLPPYSTPR